MDYKKKRDDEKKKKKKKPPRKNKKPQPLKKNKTKAVIRLFSTAGTGFFYVMEKANRFKEMLEFRKFDPRVNRHVLFTEVMTKLPMK